MSLPHETMSVISLLRFAGTWKTHHFPCSSRTLCVTKALIYPLTYSGQKCTLSCSVQGNIWDSFWDSEDIKIYIKYDSCYLKSSNILTKYIQSLTLQTCSHCCVLTEENYAIGIYAQCDCKYVQYFKKAYKEESWLGSLLDQPDNPNIKTLWTSVINLHFKKVSFCLRIFQLYLYGSSWWSQSP